MKFTSHISPESSEQLDIYATYEHADDTGFYSAGGEGPQGLLFAHVSRVTGEFVLCQCPSCFAITTGLSRREGRCSEIECGADFAEILRGFHVEGVDEPA
jgi:hypothetical protein